MKKIISILGVAAVAVIALCLPARCQPHNTSYDNYLIYNTVGLTQNTTTFISTDGLAFVSAQTQVSSNTYSNKTFTDGTQSTGSLTVVSYTALSTATATGSLTISSDTAITGQCISGGGPGLGSFNICNPANFAVSATTATTSCNIAAAINTASVLVATCSAASPTIVFTTAPYAGAVWNSFDIASSSQSAIGVPNLISSSPVTGVGLGVLSGGQNNQNFSINGKIFVANTDFFPVTSTAQTATNIATAITNSSTTINVTAAAVGTLVTTTSTIVGANTNYAMTSSSNAALSLSSPVTLSGSAGSTTMTGGTSSGWTINTAAISITSHGFPTALPVLYSTGAVAIGGLTNQTTYYISVIDPNTISLATTAALAVSGTGVVLTSSGTNTTAHTYTLAPLAISGTPSYQWVVSNDQSNWVAYTTTPANISISSVTLSSYNAAGTVTTWDLGHMDYGYLGLAVVAPTQGALTFKAKLIGKTQ